MAELAYAGDLGSPFCFTHLSPREAFAGSIPAWGIVSGLDYKPAWADAFDAAFDPRGRSSVWSLASWGNQPRRWCDYQRTLYPHGIPISGKLVDPDELMKACYEAIPPGKYFRSPQHCTYYAKAIMERCIMDQCWPDEDPRKEAMEREALRPRGFVDGRIG